MSRRACLITGGSSGIGRAVALAAAQRGYDVAVASSSQVAAGDELAEQLRGHGAQLLMLEVDVRKEMDVIEAFQATYRKFGRLDSLVNSAGVAYMAPVSQFEHKELLNVMHTNVVGLMVCCREAARLMAVSRGHHGGTIVNISSMAGTIGGRPGASSYAASKAAVDAFTVGFAREVARDGIRVNAVRPGVVVTPMTAHVNSQPDLRERVANSIPMGRLGQPDEIAAAVMFLMSDDASLVTGAALDVSGGGFTYPAA